jgi:hypothetical protein
MNVRPDSTGDLAAVVRDVRSVGRTGGRGRLAALAWGAGLAALVGISAATRLAGDASGPIPPADPGPAERPAPTVAGPATDPSAPLLVLAEPGLAATFSAGRLRVVGYRRDAGAVGAVRLSVLDERGRVLDAARVETDDRFEAVLRVPNPPSAGTIWLEVAAYAPDGTVVAATTRSLRVVPRGGRDRPTDEPASWQAARPIGEDGIMGGRPFERLPGS